MDYVAYDGAADGGEQPTSWTAVEQFLEQSQTQQQERLEQELARIKEQLDRRDAIHTAIVDELEWQVERYTDRLKKLYRHGTGRIDGTRDQVKDRIAEFQHALWGEQRDHWRDRQELEQERREIRRELQELAEKSVSELVDSLYV
jgi:trichohyalin